MKKVEHAELGVDGNCGFAFLGENIQEGECEFAEVKRIGREHIEHAEDRASRVAFNRLRARLDPEREWLTYYIGDSHPSHCSGLPTHVIVKPEEKTMSENLSNFVRERAEIANLRDQLATVRAERDTLQSALDYATAAIKANGGLVGYHSDVLDRIAALAAKTEGGGE